MAKAKRITTKSGKCKFGKVKSGERKGKCRKRKLSGAAARKRGPRTGPTGQPGARSRKRRGATFKKGRKRNVVGKKAAGSGKFCMTKRTMDGKSSTRCYRTADALENAYQRTPSSSKLKSLMMYKRKSAA